MPPVCPDLSPTQIAKERMGLIETFQCIICIQTAKSTHLCPKVRTLKRPNETFSPIIQLNDRIRPNQARIRNPLKNEFEQSVTCHLSCRMFHFWPRKTGLTSIWPVKWPNLTKPSTDSESSRKMQSNKWSHVMSHWSWGILPFLTTKNRFDVDLTG